jgi:hypothetical protein
MKQFIREWIGLIRLLAILAMSPAKSLSLSCATLG